MTNSKQKKQDPFAHAKSISAALSNRLSWDDEDPGEKPYSELHDDGEIVLFVADHQELLRVPQPIYFDGPHHEVAEAICDAGEVIRELVQLAELLAPFNRPEIRQGLGLLRDIKAAAGHTWGEPQISGNSHGVMATWMSTGGRCLQVMPVLDCGLHLRVVEHQDDMMRRDDLWPISEETPSQIAAMLREFMGNK